MRIGNHFNPFIGNNAFTSTIDTARKAALSKLAEVAPAVLRGTTESSLLTRSAALGTSEMRLPNDSAMPAYDQGKSNACGTTSLAMIMTYLGVPMTKNDVDQAIRRLDIFTAPTDMLDFARSKGLEAEGYNNGSWDEIKSYVNRGIPVQALIDVSGSGDPKKLHYVAVKGFGREADGSEYVILNDPAKGTEVKMDRAEFEKQWGSTALGFNNYFNVYAPAGTKLPPSRFDGAEATIAVASQIANLSNNLGRIGKPNDVGDVVHGTIGFLGNIVPSIGAAIYGGIGLGADWLHKKVNNIPVVREIVQPLASVVGGVTKGVAQVFNGFGRAADKIGGAFGDLFRGNFKGFVGGLARGVGAAVGGVIDGVGTAVKGVGKAVVEVAKGVGKAVETVGNAVVDAAKAVGNAVGNAAKKVGNFFKKLF